MEYLHPLLEPVLDVTYGCIVYQEQVMQIVRDVAGYSLGRSDVMRRAMSKRIKPLWNGSMRYSYMGWRKTGR